MLAEYEVLKADVYAAKAGNLSMSPTWLLALEKRLTKSLQDKTALERQQNEGRVELREVLVKLDLTSLLKDVIVIVHSFRVTEGIKSLTPNAINSKVAEYASEIGRFEQIGSLGNHDLHRVVLIRENLSVFQDVVRSDLFQDRVCDGVKSCEEWIDRAKQELRDLSVRVTDLKVKLKIE
ncbi:MAG: hypothetical protein NTV02_02210 [Candidatus Zambryskibacteria bacterium]|nr:hypothetical protein [Candidatus Zambryskibacteria bacterium]